MSQERTDAGETAPAARFRVQFEGGGGGFTVPEGQPVLAAASQSGIEMPSSCRNGSCRTCMCQLVSGQVRYRIQWPGLLPEELAAGWILPCIAYPQSDLVLRRPSGPVASTTAPDWRSTRSLNP
jgi:ferredoxin